MKKKGKQKQNYVEERREKCGTRKLGKGKDTNMKKNVRKFYKEAKEMSKEYQQQNIIYKDKKGKILTKEKNILLRWQQYFQLLLEEELQPLEETEKENENTEQLEDTDKPTYEEMIEVITNMKSLKAPGIDNITMELIKNGGPELLQRIF